MNTHIISIIRKVGAQLRLRCGNIEYKEKSAAPADVVTELDKWAEKEIFSELKKLDASIECVGEEFGGDRSANRFWLLDPIDGTAHFVRGMPFCSTMLTLVDKGEVIESYIYLFMLDEMYVARKSEGAYMNGEKVSVSSRNMQQAYYGLETKIEKPENIQGYNELMRIAGAPIRTMTAGFEFAMLASGRIDARIQIDPYGKDYDYAPGALLVKEAGGAVKSLDLSDYSYKNTSFIAANPVFFEELKKHSGLLG